MPYSEVFGRAAGLCSSRILVSLKDKKELPKWIVIPSDLHTAATAGG